MSLFKRLRQVRVARERVAAYRNELAMPAAQLLERGYRHPLTTVGAAAGAGFALGTLGVGPMRVPGLVSLVSTGFAEVVAHGARWIAEFSADQNVDSDSDYERDDT
ncbi:hypothetical protein [Dyella sp. 2HG41-7]|uniref:hypothetical protein n=1 Tax=Dyella sp. 2HG41-7 TaxID=2883239 RepID=UPI001F1CDA29|nr:hypothetical protein [Dyella sp. 2HG41-7]